ncbi:hypothetical protein HHK36_030422 [Tetracentron sinense]|uniref:RING-CH-type domain-containing protein n=1 Tax=Tetracentron sinense TaxID=13715 RepID=A0A835CYP9_TETSI|nr:hypothetical protein HHK36_030422 [Tetracentron sinense]
MGRKEDRLQTSNGGVSNEDMCSAMESDNLGTYWISRPSVDKEVSLATCRVCQCAESDIRGDAALGFLGITPPLQEVLKVNEDLNPNSKEVVKGDSDVVHTKNDGSDSGFIEFISPEGEVFICNTDIEAGSDHHQDTLIELGCSCKNDLALAHYACALKWFINHGSIVCEICGSVAKNVRTADFKKVMASLKDYEELRERTVSGGPTPAHLQTNSGVDPDAVAAIRRQRLSEISLWFNPHNYTNTAVVSQVVTEQHLNIVTEDVIRVENPATKWAVECTGILLATGLLTVTLAWLIAPRVGKKTAKSGLHILLGGVCALTVVVFFRFVSDGLSDPSKYPRRCFLQGSD